jgi:methylenetetrahydrofolate reductase (NADPH)
VSRRLRGVPPDRVADEGLAICAETISELAQVPGLAGVHVMAVGAEHRIPVILRQAGLAPMLATGRAGHAG